MIQILIKQPDAKTENEYLEYILQLTQHRAFRLTLNALPLNILKRYTRCIVSST